jgi:hypothetical protein
MRRERNIDGGWGYCRRCGHKAYETSSRITSRGVYSMCAYQCGYISTFREVIYQKRNTIEFEGFRLLKSN